MSVAQTKCINVFCRVALTPADLMIYVMTAIIQIKGFIYNCPFLGTIFTWLNAAATISLVTKIDVATIRGSVYCTKHYYMRLLLKLTSNSKKFQVCCAIMSIP